MAAPTSVLNVKSAGRLKDGDVVFTLKVPELDGKYRFEQLIFRVMPSGQPVIVIRTAPDNGSGQPGAYGDENIKQAEYWANYTSWANFDAAPYLKKMLDAGIFAKESQLTGGYTPTSRFPTAPTSQETDYTIDSEGIITRSPKPASGADVKDGQDKQNALLGTLVNSLTNPNGTTTGSGSATGTQKLVRYGLLAVGAGVLIWVLISFNKKKK